MEWAKALLIRGCRSRVGKACSWREHPRESDASPGAFPGLRFHLPFCKTEHKCKTFSQMFLTGCNRILNGSALNTGLYYLPPARSLKANGINGKTIFKKGIIKYRVAGQPPRLTVDAERA